MPLSHKASDSRFEELRSVVGNAGRKMGAEKRENAIFTFSVPIFPASDCGRLAAKRLTNAHHCHYEMALPANLHSSRAADAPGFYH
jgi:hypothetical protein